MPTRRIFPSTSPFRALAWPWQAFLRAWDWVSGLFRGGSPAPGTVDGGEVRELRRGVIMAVVMVGPFMALLEGSIVNVALPSMMTAFGANIDQVKWVNTAFLLSSAVGMPVTGWLGRRFGLGRTYIGEIAVFTLGSGLCAVAWSLDVLIVARIIQAVGAGSLMPTSLAIVSNLYPSHQRGKALGIWGIGFIAGPALGPTVGGVIIEWMEWRAIFSINIPVGIMIILTALITMDPGERNRTIVFDWRGYVSLAIFLVAGLLTVEQGNEVGWGSVHIQLGAGLALAAFMLFVVFSLDGDHAILPPRLFQNPDFGLATWLGMTRSMALFSGLFMLPVFLQNIQGRDPIETGLLMMPTPIFVAITMPIAGMLTDRFGPRWLVMAGVVLASVSLFLFAGLDRLSTRWEVIYPQVYRGIGFGLMNTPVSTAAMNAVRREDAGTASWVITLTRMLTASTIIALVGSLLPVLRTIELERLGATDILRGDPPQELVHRAMALGYAAQDAATVARSYLVQHLTIAADTLAFKNLYLSIMTATLTGLLPAFLLSSRPKSASR